MRRTTLLFVTSMFVLVGCSSSPETAPLTLPPTSTAVVPAIDPGTQPQDITPADLIPLNPSTGDLPGSVDVGVGPADIGPDCAEHLQPVRDLLNRARSGQELTEEEARSIENRLADAGNVCTPDEYVSFQMEMFPPSEFEPVE